MLKPSVEASLLKNNTSRRHRSGFMRRGLGTFAAMAAILILATALRLYSLSDHGLYGDELWTIERAQNSIAWITENTAQPLSYILVHLSLKLGPGSFFVRLPSAVAGILGTIAIFFLGKRLFGEIEGLVAAFLLAISAFHISHSQFARYYAFMVLFSSLSMVFFFAALKAKDWKLWAGFVIATVLNLFTHIFSLFVLAGLVLVGMLLILIDRLKNKEIVVHDLEQDPNKLRSVRKPTTAASARGARWWMIIKDVSHRLVPLFLSLCVIAALYLPALHFVFDLISGQTNQGLPGRSTPGFVNPSSMLIEVLSAFASSNRWIIIAAALTLMIGVVVSLRRNRTLLAATIFLTGLPLAILATFGAQQPLHPRHMSFLLPIYLMLIASGLVYVGKVLNQWTCRLLKTHERPLRPFVILVVAAFGILGMSSLRDHYARQPNDWMGIGIYLERSVNSGDLVVLTPSPVVKMGLQYYFDSDKAQSRILYLGPDTVKDLRQPLAAGSSIWWVVVENSPIPDEIKGQITLETRKPGLSVLHSRYDVPGADLVMTDSITVLWSYLESWATSRHFRAREMQSAAAVTLGILCLEMEDFECATDVFENAIELAPSDQLKLSVMVAIVRAYDQVGDTENALNTLALAKRIAPSLPWNADLPLLESLAMVDVAMARERLSVNPDNAEAHVLIGNSHRVRGRTKEAINEYMTALKIDPNLIWAQMELGTMLITADRVDEALVHFLEAIRIDPRFVEAHIQAGNTYYQLGDVSKAFERYYEAIDLDPQSTWARSSLAQIYVDTGYEENAIEQYEMVLDIDPMNLGIRVVLSKLYLGFGRGYDAIEVLLPTIDQQSLDGILTLGNAYRLVGQYDEAIAAYQRCLEEDPNFISAYNALGSIYGDLGRLGEAEGQLKIVIAANPEMASAYWDLAQLYESMGREADAIDLYEQAVALEPESEQFHVSLGRIYMENSLIEQAIGEFQEAIQLKPTENWYRVLIGDAYLRSGEIDLAIDALLVAVQLDVTNYWAHVLLGDTYMAQSKPKEALAQYLLAAQYGPIFAQEAGYHKRIAQANFAMGELEAAIAHYSEAIRLDPAWAALHYELSLVYEELDQTDATIVELEKYLQLAPDGSHSVEATKKLEQLRGDG